MVTKKRNILICWEFGGGLGHYVPVTIMAKMFNEKDFNVTLVLKDLSRIEYFKLPPNIKCIKTPHIFNTVKDYTKLSTLSEILFVNGFNNEDNLKSTIDGWFEIFDIYKPDVIINDYSPFSVIASKIKNILSINVGTGFFIPPITKDILIFRKWETVNIEKCRQTEKIVLENINNLFSNTKIQFESVIEAVRANTNFITSFPFIDHYSTEREISEQNLFVGNIVENELGFKYDWPDTDRKKIMIYIKKDYKYLRFILKELMKLNIDVLIFNDNFNKNIKELISNSNIYLSDDILNFDHNLNYVDLFICNAGNSGLIFSIKKEVPILVLPMHSEQYLLSEVIEENEIGIHLKFPNINDNFIKNIYKILNDNKYKNNIINYKNKYSELFKDNSALNKIYDVVVSNF